VVASGAGLRPGERWERIFDSSSVDQQRMPQPAGRFP
jgi:hypothetical protein